MTPPSPDDIIGLDMIIRGQVIVPGSILYETEAKKHHNAMHHSNKPAFYVHCKDIADVQETLKFVTAHGMALSIRSGAHNVSGSSIRNGSVVVDVGGISHVEYDESTEQVTVGPGATLGDVNIYLLRRGRMAPTGVVPTTGCGGLITQGGVGFLQHRYGTSVDNVTALTIVLADGTVKNLDHQSSGEDRELFFAARGAAGVLGLVTSITMHTYPVESVTGGLWAMLDDSKYTKTRKYVKMARDLILEQEKSGSRKLFGSIYMANLPPEESIPEEMRGHPCTIFDIACWGTGEEEEEMMRKFADRDIVFGKQPGQMPFNVFNQLLAGVFLKFPPFGTYWKTPFTDKLLDEDVDAFCDKYAGHETWLNGGFCGFDFHGSRQGRRHGKKLNEGNDNCVTSLRDFLFVAPSYLYFPPSEDNFRKARTIARDMASIFEEQRVSSYSNFLLELEDEAESERETALCFSGAQLISKVKKCVDPNDVFTNSVIAISSAEETHEISAYQAKEIPAAPTSQTKGAVPQ